MRMIPIAVLCGGLAGMWSVQLSAGSISYFRHDAGVAADDQSPLPDDFGSANQLVWRQEFDPGHSTPCLTDQLIVLTTYREEEQELATVALDRRTGNLRWKRVVPAERIEPFHRVGSPAASTAASDGERLFVFVGSYGLLCYNLDGDELWSKKMGPFQDEFGASSSPVLVDGKVILNEDHDVDSFVIAIDQQSGETVWKVPREGFTRSYSTPVIWDNGGVRELIVAGSLKMIAYDTSDGRERWWLNGLSRIVDVTPALVGDKLYFASWTPGGDSSERISMEPFAEALQQYDKNGDGKIGRPELPEGNVLARFFRIDLNQDQMLDETEWAKHARVFELAQNVAMSVRLGGEGDVGSSHVKWTYRKGLPTVPSPLVYRGVLYMIKDSGIVTALDAESGELLKQLRAAGRGNYYASPVAGDGKVYLASEQGVATILSGGKDPEILASHDFNERIMATPVILDGRLYLRTDEAVYCFEKR